MREIEKKLDQILAILLELTQPAPQKSGTRFDFEDVYALYPRKLGKVQGIKKCQRDIKSPQDLLALKQAIKRFSDFHRAQGTEPQFIPYFSSFMTVWRDWLDPSIGQSGLFVPEESTHEYLERTERKKVEEEWPEANPEKVRAIMKSFLKPR